LKCINGSHIVVGYDSGHLILFQKNSQ
jgi:hypothetical protein